MRLLEEAGLPPGVINFVYGAARADRRRGARERRTSPGSTSPARPRSSTRCGRRSARTSTRYRNYPRIVGETGGKDFIVAHPSADVDAVATAIVRGSFEYQGQKCSAASRVYAPSNLWPELRERLVEEVGTIKMGDVSRLLELHGRRDRRQVVRDARREAIEDARAQRRARCSSAAAPTTARATSSSRP